jgi:DNA-binding NarL/FixJ family response regulator
MVSTQPIQVVFVDDHKVVVDGLSSILRDHEVIRVAGTFTHGEAALHFLSTAHQQGNPIGVVMCDLRMQPQMSGLEFAIQLRSHSPTTKVIILSMSEDPTDIAAAIQLGVAGYVTKSQDSEAIFRAIVEVMRDTSRTYLSQDVLKAFASATGTPNPSINERGQLTRREIEILKLIASEHNTSQIASLLFISEATVDTHRRNLIQKLNVRGIVGLSNFAIRHGLV